MKWQWLLLLLLAGCVAPDAPPTPDDAPSAGPVMQQPTPVPEESEAVAPAIEPRWNGQYHVDLYAAAYVQNETLPVFRTVLNESEARWPFSTFTLYANWSSSEEIRVDLKDRAACNVGNCPVLVSVVGTSPIEHEFPRDKLPPGEYLVSVQPTTRVARGLTVDVQMRVS